MKIIHVVGARPNFVKIAPIMREMAKYPDDFEQLLVHTGQHYDYRMSEIFFEDLELPDPNIHLAVGSGSHAEQTARIMMMFEPVLLQQKPDWVIVAGDVNSTLACALTAAKLSVPVAHVEAGLRCFDRTMPEEINRVLTDQIAALLFTTEPSANENLRREGIPAEKVHFVGNVMIDALVRFLPRAAERWNALRSKLNLEDAPGMSAEYVLVTLHRPSNVDDPEILGEIMAALTEISQKRSVLFPVHPRTATRISGLNSVVLDSKASNVRLIEPLGYLDFLALLQHARLLITDSGGVQEETTYLGVPCLTVRPATERPVTVELGTNRLVRGERHALVQAAQTILRDIEERPCTLPELWDGKAAERIVAVLRGQSFA